jgi:hypothetical protein
MMLSLKSIDSLKNRPVEDIWNLITALQQWQNALFQLEKNENDIDILKDLATQSCEVGKQLEVILQILEEKIED